eukprot:350621-Chlamydomonas_euryale.AAC.6
MAEDGNRWGAPFWPPADDRSGILQHRPPSVRPMPRAAHSLVCNHAGLDIVAVGQTQVLLGSHVAQQRRACSPKKTRGITESAPGGHTAQLQVLWPGTASHQPHASCREIAAEVFLANASPERPEARLLQGSWAMPILALPALARSTPRWQPAWLSCMSRVCVHRPMARNASTNN